jgi:16S rRNA (adenine1518-N6/adenine1519-N6)-dimethyltransferase
MKKHQPRKRFGQNFLQNKDILCQITQSLRCIPSPETVILEIGPGQGALTDYLLELGVSIHSIEIDRDLVVYLKEKYKNSDRFFIHENDILNVNLSDFTKKHGISHIIGNLPYNISTPFLIQYEKQCPHLSATFLVQKEVALRLSSACGSKHYGRLSLAIQHSFHIETICNVGPENFYPAPKVQSQVIRLDPKTDILERSDKFQAIIDIAFQQRRKTLRNALSQWSIPFEKIGIDPSRRPETLSEIEFNLIALNSSLKIVE